jgi:hypothetical protein
VVAGAMALETKTLGVILLINTETEKNKGIYSCISKSQTQ